MSTDNTEAVAVIPSRKSSTTKATDVDGRAGGVDGTGSDGEGGQSRYALRAAVAVLVTAVAFSGVNYVALWLDDRWHPPQCYGIGWGCSPGPETSLFLGVVFVVVPAVLAGLLVIGLSVLLGSARWRRRVAYTTAGLVGIAALAITVTLWVDVLSGMP